MSTAEFARATCVASVVTGQRRPRHAVPLLRPAASLSRAPAERAARQPAAVCSRNHVIAGASAGPATIRVAAAYSGLDLIGGDRRENLAFRCGSRSTLRRC